MLFWLAAAYVFVGALLLSFSTSHDIMAKPEEHITSAHLRAFCQSRDVSFLSLSLLFAGTAKLVLKDQVYVQACVHPPTRPELWYELVQNYSKQVCVHWSQ